MVCSAKQRKIVQNAKTLDMHENNLIFTKNHGFSRAASSAQVFSKCFAPGGGEQWENVGPQFPTVGKLGPDSFPLPPPLVYDPPQRNLTTTKF